MARLNEKDRELTATGQTIDLSSNKYAYLGGEFLTNPNDYIELLIYDLNNNFLESAVVNEEDYLYDSDKGVTLKTGSILRKMGYDRGKFVVKYNFLRRVAGSYENVAVDANNRVVEDYIEGETRLKEFKYFIHEISPSRSELRIVPQNISNELYLNEFYDMQRTNKRINTGNSVIGFEPATDGDNLGTDTDPSVYTSKTIKVQNVDSGTDPLSDGFLFDRKMVNATLTVPGAFITAYIPPPVVYQDGDAPTGDVETESDILQPSFYISSQEGVYSQEGMGGGAPDLTLTPYFTAFKSFDTVDTALNGALPDPPPWGDPGVSYFPDKPRTLENIKQLRSGYFKFLYYEVSTEKTATVVFTSNSALPDVPTTYTWQITGWDWDSSKGNYGEGYWPLDGNQGGTEPELDGDFYIIPQTSAGTNYAHCADELASPHIATFEYDGLEDTPTGCSLAVKIIGGDITLGVMLTISQGTANTKTIHYPAVIRTVWKS